MTLRVFEIAVKSEKSYEITVKNRRSDNEGDQLVLVVQRRNVNSFIKDQIKKAKKSLFMHDDYVCGKKEVGLIKKSSVYKVTESGTHDDVSEGCGDYHFTNDFFFFNGYRFYVDGFFRKAKTEPEDAYIRYCVKKQIEPTKEASFVEFGNNVVIEYR